MNGPRHRSAPRLAPAGMLLATLLSGACASSSHRPAGGGARGHAPPDRGYDVEHYSLDLTLLPESRSIEGSCRIRLVPEVDGLQELLFDLDGLEVRRVVDHRGEVLEFRREGEELAIRCAAPLAVDSFFELTVEYGGAPHTGLWFSGEGPRGATPTQMFTQGQAEESRGWFPCFDHLSDRATSEIRVTMPETWVAVAPGVRIDVQESAGQRTEHWRMSTPHPCYLTSLVAGEFIVVEDRWEDVPLQYLASEQERDHLQAGFSETGAMLSFLSDTTGIRYPYGKYSQACVDNFPWGGMENISATTLTPLMLSDERGNRDRQSTDLVVHEAAHQWFGDLFTCADWSHLWLNEGLATYMEILYAEQVRGVDPARVLMRNAWNAYLAEDSEGERRATVSSRWIDPEDIMDTRIYEGAAARLHFLRFLIGDSAFRTGLQSYCRENAGRDVVTADFQRAMETASGRDLNDFFEQWILRPGHPEFEVEWSWEASDQSLSLEVRQVQSSADGTPHVYRIPVDIEVVDQAGSRLHRVSLASRRDKFKFETQGRPVFVRFDKLGWIPKQLSFPRSPSAWRAIARDDDDVNGRRDAVGALGDLAARALVRGDLEQRAPLVAELVDRLRRDSSPAVRTAAARALGLAGGVEARERLIVAAENDEHAPVRSAALKALAAYGANARLAEVGRRAFDTGYSWDSMAAAARLVCVAEPDAALEWLLPKLLLPSPHDRLRAALLRVLGELPDGGLSERLRRWASDGGTHPSARAAALAALGSHVEEARRNSEFLRGFLDSRSFRLREAALQALVELDDDSGYAALEEYYPRARTPGERRTLEAVLAEGRS